MPGPGSSMSFIAPLFESSGDLLADRRYEHAKDFAARGDLDAAADVLAQAVERAPNFVSGWIALGDMRERTSDPAGAIAAFHKALGVDPDDRYGAVLRLARLGAANPSAAMSPAYVRTLFDQYAPHFDVGLVQGLLYRGPKILREAIERTGHGGNGSMRFSRMLDLGCGTGLAGAEF